jgi:hypothetical protein
MRQMFFQIGAAVLVLGAIYMVVFQRDWLMGKAREAVLQAKGFKAAQTPQECVDKFREAIKNRDYDAASTVYCTGLYAEQMKKAAAGATALGNAVDNLLHQMKVKEYDSDKVIGLLTLMEPFPLEFEVQGMKEQDSTATCRLVETSKVDFKNDPSWYNLKADTLFYRALVNGAFPANIPVTIKKVGDGKDKAWRLEIPVDGSGLNIRGRVDRLVAKYKTYVKVLEKLKYEVTHEPMTKADLEQRVKTELETAAKD